LTQEFARRNAGGEANSVTKVETKVQTRADTYSSGVIKILDRAA